MLSAQSADTELVQLAREGDRLSFGRLYETHRRMVHGILLARVPHADVEDLVQTVFLSAFQKIPGLRDAGFFGGWLAAIARNTANDFHRRSKSRFEKAREDVARCLSPGRPDSDVAAEAAMDAIQRLPDTYRETLVLRLVEGMTGPEIAAQTGLSPDSVRVNLCRGMKLLRKGLGVKADDV